jgi:hypothetical protein|tara:strand:- start:8998 stop:9771 length:774 start_codon:yes stop_codon:yes gene_type:complete
MIMGSGNLIMYEDLAIRDRYLPPSTRSYTPVPWKYFVDLQLQALHHSGHVIQRLELKVSGFSKKLGLPGELLGLATLNGGDADLLKVYAFRTSLNKAHAPMAGGGAQVDCCTNGEFRAEYFAFIRKQTRYVLNDLPDLVERGIASIDKAYDRIRVDRDALAAVPLDTEEGFRLLGSALGHGVVTPNQATVALGDWKEPRHEEFEARNMWSFNNCLTEGAKKGTAATYVERHSAIHGFVVAEARKQIVDPRFYDEVPF